MISIEIQDSFFSGIKTVEMHYTINDAVTVVSGNNTGAVGSVISITEIEPELKYLIETSAGKDIEVKQSNLQSLYNGI